MARLTPRRPRGAARGFRPDFHPEVHTDLRGGRFVDPRAGDGVPPLRFDVPAGAPKARHDDHAEQHRDETYRAPRAGWWRALRGSFLLAAVCGGLIAVTWLAWAPVLEGVAAGASALVEREGDGRTRVTATVALGSVAVLGFVVAWWRASHPRRAVHLSGDRGRIGVDAVAGQLRALILAMDEVRDAEVTVENRGRGRVRARALLQVSPVARIDDVLDGVDAAAEALIHGRLGLSLSEPPLADVHYEELDLRAAHSIRAPAYPDEDA